MGAGLGGLCLAQGLRRQGVEVTLFERDDALLTRSQGYRLYIDPDGDPPLPVGQAWLVWEVVAPGRAESCPRSPWPERRCEGC
ncbi:NAD(P)-binding protein [Streptomyces sp. NPDC127051]|uniref:NAD(P)-binding protein n=1 Tax=Streptomyces sp. NPDC127051 TaxID=3347119 RepID=UPI00364DFCE6